MKEPRSERPVIINPGDHVKGDVKPTRFETPNERPKPTPNPPKKK